MANNINLFRKQVAFIFLLFIILVPISIYLYVQHRWIVNSLPLGSQIPSVVVTTLNGEDKNTETLITKKTVLVFFSTTCQHCKSELRILDSLHQEFKNSFDIIAFSANSQKETEQFVNEFDIPFPIFLDKKNDAKFQFRVILVPALFFISQQKRLLKYTAGELHPELLYTMLTSFASSQNDSISDSI